MTYRYSNHSATTGFLYNDDMLLVNANALSTDIAKASVVMSTAAYDGNGETIRTMLNDMGFYCSNDDWTYSQARSITDNDRVAYIIPLA